MSAFILTQRPVTASRTGLDLLPGLLYIGGMRHPVRWAVSAFILTQRPVTASRTGLDLLPGLLCVFPAAAQVRPVDLAPGWWP